MSKTAQWEKQLRKEFPDWTLSRSKNNHIALTHKVQNITIHTSSTPSDHRVLNNLKSQARHALAGRCKFRGTA